ncbi:MAG: hypothetical protein ACREQ5_12585 [Candidatus Dormibacteria bacterium]
MKFLKKLVLDPGAVLATLFSGAVLSLLVLVEVSGAIPSFTGSVVIPATGTATYDELAASGCVGLDASKVAVSSTNCVDTTTSQIIGGMKTFSSPLSLTGSFAYVGFDSPNPNRVFIGGTQIASGSPYAGGVQFGDAAANGGGWGFLFQSNSGSKFGYVDNYGFHTFPAHTTGYSDSYDAAASGNVSSHIEHGGFSTTLTCAAMSTCTVTANGTYTFAVAYSSASSYQCTLTADGVQGLIAAIATRTATGITAGFYDPTSAPESGTIANFIICLGT